MIQLRKKTLIESLRFRGIYYCLDCPRVVKLARLPFDPAQQTSRCPCCGTLELQALPEPDPINAMHGRFVGVIYHWLTGARLLHCVFCRIQFYDSRPLWSDAAAPISAQPALPELNPAAAPCYSSAGGNPRALSTVDESVWSPGKAA